MKKTLIAAMVLGAALTTEAGAWENYLSGVYGPKGNDTGGIIPWSPENEINAFAIAQANCSFYNKYAVATSIRRRYGDYIAYRCQWDAPVVVATTRRTHRTRVDVTIDK